MSTIKLVGFLMLTTLWALIATYQWLTVRAQASLKTELEVKEQVLTNQVIVLQDALEQAQRAQLAAEEAKAEVQKKYKPVKEVVYANRVISQCAGAFPDSLRNGMETAVAASNETLPAAEDR